MKEYEIWAEGFAVTGNIGHAQLLGKYKAETWEAAVLKYMNDNPQRITVDKRGFTDWGCKLFDNETDARASFG